MTKVGVIGAGSFGTALACTLANGGNSVSLWGRNKDHIHSMRSSGENTKYLPSIQLPSAVEPTNDLSKSVGCDIVLLAIPAQNARNILTLEEFEKLDAPLVLCSKGIERDTGLLQSQLVQELLSDTEFAVLTGPGFATEIAAGKPTAFTIAASKSSLGKKLQADLTTQSLRLYLSDDPIGAQLGGALKNVLAIACGVVSGAGLGESARAALMTRGFVEVSRLAQSLGAKKETLAGLSGFGDLVLTCTSLQSRNFEFGFNLGKSGKLETKKTVEGIATARATVSLAQKQGTEMPIAQIVAAVLEKEATIQDALNALMSRPLKQET